jgi:DinB superfamily
MNTECLYLADQLHRAFHGEAWHGPSLREVLAQVTAEQAASHPAIQAHSIWEIVLHIHTWTHAATESTRGALMPPSVNDLPPEKDWPPVQEKTVTGWKHAIQQMFQAAEELRQAVKTFGDARLQETVPGRNYNFYFLFHGVVQHSLYHAGQIALLKKMLV